MGFAKLIFICLSLLVTGVAQASELDTSRHSSDPFEGNWVELQGENSVAIPNLTLARPTTSWSYPYTVHPVYSQNQSISGVFFGSEDLANRTIELQLAALSRYSFLSAVDVLDEPSNLTSVYADFGPINLNATGDASFDLPGTAAGIYALYVILENSTDPLSASPIVVTEDDIEIETLPEIVAGDILPVNVKLENASDGRDLHYGAFMVSAEDYRGLSLNLTGDGTLNGTLIKVNWNDDQFDIEGDFEVGWDLLTRLLLIFPNNSAAALQDSDDGEAELYMITEDGWKPGSYVITCCVISEDSVVGLNQTEVVITC